MSVINIREAQRSGSRVVIGLAGESGTGKTLTALYLAWGLAGYDSKKIGFLDTENKRGSLYADSLKDDKGNIHRFMIGDLYPPFSPQRYIDAIREFEKAGVEVLVVDSVTHEWEGEGGCDDIAHNTTGKMANWKLAKKEHKRFMNALLQCDMHIIPCIRAREKTDFSNPKEPRSLGVQPVCEKNFMFEMTASLQMHDQGMRQTVLKCPEELQQILGRGQGYIGPADGKAVRDWVNGATGEKRDPKLEKWANSLRGQTEQGTKHLKDCWDQVPEKVQQALGGDFYEELKASAEAYDKLREQAGVDPEADDAIAGLNEKIGSEPSNDNQPDTNKQKQE